MCNEKLIVYLLCLTATCFTVNGQIEEIITAEVLKSVINGVQRLYQAYEVAMGYVNDLNAEPDLTNENRQLSLMNSVEELKTKISKLESDEADVINMKKRMYDLQIQIGEIDRRYDNYLRIKKKRSAYAVNTLKRFYEQVTNDNEGLPDILYFVHENIVGMNNGSLIDIMERYIEYLSPYCQRVESRQQYFYKFFIAVVSHEIKGRKILDFAYRLREELNNITLVPETKDMHAHSNKRILKTIEMFKNVMVRAELDMWKCDPDKHNNHTYVELKNVFRRIFYNAIEFTDYSQTMSCYTYNCPKLETNRIESKCNRKKCNLRQRHCSDVLDCERLDYDDAYGVCVSQNQHDGRRYDYVHKYDSDWNAILKYKNCNGIFRNVKTRAGGAWAGDCNACNCICNESEDSDRYISLKPVESDVDNNYVVTGVQFVLQDHTLYIKIQQGKLLPYAFISQKTTEWKDVEVASDEHLSNLIMIDDEPHVIQLKDDFSFPAQGRPKVLYHLFEGKEKFKIDWHNRRGLYLDDLSLKKNEVVTGVRFLINENENGNAYVGLDIQATPFNYSTGKLSMRYSYWLSTENNHFNRDELQLGKYDSPTSLDVKNILDNIPHQFSEFTPSNYTSKDAGQTTLPLIDIQPVVMDTVAPLTGISLDIKRANDSAGYLVLKITPYNILWHMDFKSIKDHPLV